MRLAFLLPLVLLVAACTQSADKQGDTPPLMVSPILTGQDAQDPWSYAQPQVARVTHVALDLALDFKAHTLSGTATLDILAKPDADQIVLDDDGLNISGITDGAGGALDFSVGEGAPGKGTPVTVEIGRARKIVVSYSTSPDAAALQWLAPEQTAGKKQPYLFSQGEPILNRTWIPTQDSPGIRQSWEAKITAPAQLTVVMSALRDGDPQPAGEGLRSFRFKMDKPVAPYLIAIAAGDIAYRELGPRTGVWTEPSMLDAAASELADTEKMVDAAEQLYGPYRWGRYEMIVLPPSFPYGGMENPTMTFLTPTFIAGDRSLTDLVAHELAHSWSGNLVTNANWSDSWLNEGITTYFQSRIIEKLYGTKRADQEYALAFAEMEQTIKELGPDNPQTALHLPPELAAPDGGNSAIIYDKGAAFMRTVEKIAGRERFDAWLQSWFDRHAFQPATSAMLLADMRQNLVKGDAALEGKLMLSQWIFGTGLPENVARPPASVFADVDRAAEEYARTGEVDTTGWGAWSTDERLRFLSRVPEKRSSVQLARLDRDLKLSQSGNDEILFAWLKLALGNKYQPAVPLADKFLSSVGRTKFVAPLYQTLLDHKTWGVPIAKRIYDKDRMLYHAVTRGAVDKLFAPPAGS